MILFYLTQDLIGRKFLMVENENDGTGKPLSVQFTPCSLAPSGICYSQMDAVFMQIMPEYASRKVSHRVKEIVDDHLRFSTRSTGEIHQHGVLITVHMFRTNEFWSTLPFFTPVVEFIVYVVSYSDKYFMCRTVCFRFFNLF